MSPLTSLLSADIAAGVALIAVAGLVEPFVEYHVERLLADNRFALWAFEHVFAPLLRALYVAGFVLLAYPSLYGVRSAPAIADLVAGGSLRLTNLVNVLFVVSLLLPLLLPNFRRTALLVPAQGLLATAMVFSWYTDYIGAASIGWWPGMAPALAIAVMVVIGHRLALETGLVLGDRADAWFGTDGLRRVLPHAAELVAQLPAVIYYGLSLGRQIAI